MLLSYAVLCLVCVWEVDNLSRWLSGLYLKMNHAQGAVPKYTYKTHLLGIPGPD